MASENGLSLVGQPCALNWLRSNLSGWNCESDSGKHNRIQN